MDGIAAAEHIQRARPDVKTVTVLKEGSMVTRDMRFDRVRIFVDENEKVVKPPRVG
jgi:hypothetical protein